MNHDETEPMPLGGDRRQHRRLVRFDPTFSSGSIAQIIALLIGLGAAYGKYESDRATTKKDIETQQKEIDAMRAATLAEKLETRAAINELKLDLRQVQTGITSVDKTLTGIKAEIDASKGKKQ